MDRKEDDTHKASDGQTKGLNSGHSFSEGMSYDPFVLFGPGSAGKRRRLEHEGLIKRLNVYCKRCGCRSVFCKCTIDGGIGRIFMNRRQIDISYTLLYMRESIPDKPSLVRSLFERTVRQGRYYWRGIKIEYRDA